MTGLAGLTSHLVTIALLWLAVVTIAWLIRWAIFRTMADFSSEVAEERKKLVQRIFRLINLSATVVALIFVIIFVLFMSSPLEKNYGELDKIRVATPDQKFVKPTPQEIEQSNKEVLSRKGKEKEEVAEADNKAAMDEAAEIFGADKEKD